MNSRDWTIVLLVILGIFVLLPILGMGFGGFGMMGPGMMGGRGMMGGWSGGGFGWGGLLFIALVIVGIVLIARGLLARPGTTSDGALEILRQRLAKGEITKEQFEELRKTLQ